MFRVFTMLAGYKYYWSGSHWTMWGHAARLLGADDALSIAMAENADVEEAGA
jgi:hypothetical protein